MKILKIVLMYMLIGIFTPLSSDARGRFQLPSSPPRPTRMAECNALSNRYSRLSKQIGRQMSLVSKQISRTPFKYSSRRRALHNKHTQLYQQSVRLGRIRNSAVQQCRKRVVDYQKQQRAIRKRQAELRRKQEMAHREAKRKADLRRKQEEARRKAKRQAELRRKKEIARREAKRKAELERTKRETKRRLEILRKQEEARQAAQRRKEKRRQQERARQAVKRRLERQRQKEEAREAAKRRQEERRQEQEEARQVAKRPQEGHRSQEPARQERAARTPDPDSQKEKISKPENHQQRFDDIPQRQKQNVVKNSDDLINQEFEKSINHEFASQNTKDGFQSNPKRFEPLGSQRARDSAALSAHVYKIFNPSYVDPPGYELVEKHSKNGFQGGAYKNLTTGEITVVFAGTDPTEIKDLFADSSIASGVEQFKGSPKYGPDIKSRRSSNALDHQIDEAQKFYNRVSKIYKQKPSIAGHSLGGVSAQIIGANNGVPTHTYNSPGVPPSVIKKYGVNLNPTNVINHGFERDLVYNYGNHVGKEKKYPASKGINPFRDHGISKFIQPTIPSASSKSSRGKVDQEYKSFLKDVDRNFESQLGESVQ